MLSVDQFDRAAIDRVFSIADEMEPYAHRKRITRVLEGAILGNMFFEPSTRTRISFGCAFNLLGGDVRETTEVKASSLAKGESLFDTARVLSGYSDIIVMRHSGGGFGRGVRDRESRAGDQCRRRTRTSTRARRCSICTRSAKRWPAADARSTVCASRWSATCVTVARCTRCANCSASSTAIHFNLVSPPGLEAPDDIIEALRARGHQVTLLNELAKGIHHVDILYVTRTQEERFPSQEEADRYRGLFRLNQAVYTENCEPNTVIMHPLPRDSRSQANELDADLDQNPNLAIFRQTDNGVLLRMALFALILDVADEVHNHAPSGHLVHRQTDSAALSVE